MLSEENCENILTYAKLEATSFHQINQTILFNEDFNKENCCIFKLNNDILNDLNIKVNSQFSIKGKDNDTAVLCTETKSYEIRESETSNTLLILPEINLDFNENDENGLFLTNKIYVSSTCNKFYELHLRKAKIGEIYKILQDSIQNHHLEVINCDKCYNFQSLLNEVAVSENELRNGLRNLKVYETNGMLNMFSIDYVYDVVLKILECSFENDFSILNLSHNNVHTMLANLFPMEILNQTLEFYFEKVSENDFDTFWKVNELEVTRCFAEKILDASNKITVEDFQIQWRKILPEELDGKLQNLHGLAMINETFQPPTVKLLKSTTLSDEPEERFRELFQEKSHWKQDELEGFIRDIVPADSSASQLIMKYSRCSNNSKTKIFSKR